MELAIASYMGSLAGITALTMLVTGYLTKSFIDQVLFSIISIKQIVSIAVAEAICFGALVAGFAGMLAEMSTLLVVLTGLLASGLANGWISHGWAKELLVLLRARIDRN